MVHETIRRLLNRPIKDIYGRQIGHIVSVDVSKEGEIQQIAVEHHNGSFGIYDKQRLVFAGEDVMMIPVWKSDAEELIRRIRDVERRMAALDQLSRQGRISQIAYERLRREYDSELQKLQEIKSKLVEELRQRLSLMEHQEYELEKAIAIFKVRRIAGEIEEESYHIQIDSLQAGLQRVRSEINDLRSILKELGVET